MHPLLRRGKKIATAIVGGLVALVGIILIPYPGPGWFIVFAGLAILATEFTFAEKTLAVLKTKYESWTRWLKQQPRIVRLVVLAFTGLVIVVTIWLLNSFGLVDTIFHLHQHWLHSPLLSK